MAKEINIRGLGTALITPFEDGEVDYEAYRHLLASQISAGADFLVPLGTTGETPCLDDDEKVKIVELTDERAGDKTVMAGVGTNSLKGTLANIRLLRGHGADAFLVVVPYYNKPTQRGQLEYFTEVAEESSKPIVIYNVPSRTGVNMEAETTLKLAEHPNIIGIKEASGNLEQIYKIIDSRPEGFVVLSGNDDQTLDIMRHGGDGVISVASNITPFLMKSLVSTIWTDKAERLNNQLMPLFKACFMESNPIPTKAALSAMGLIENELRLPLTPCEPKTMETMKAVLDDLELL